MKTSFRYDTTEKVRQKEGVDEWMIPSELAVFADLYETDRPDSQKSKFGGIHKNNNNSTSTVNISKNNNASVAVKKVIHGRVI